MLSNILCYCTNDETADFFCEILSPGGGVRAILANERGAEQVRKAPNSPRNWANFSLLYEL